MQHLNSILKRLEILSSEYPEHIILDDYWLDDLCDSLVTQKQNSSQNQRFQLIVWRINPELANLFRHVRDLLDNKYIPCALVIPTNTDPYITLAPNLPKPSYAASY
jgi:hypothetical protein